MLCLQGKEGNSRELAKTIRVNVLFKKCGASRTLSFPFKGQFRCWNSGFGMAGLGHGAAICPEWDLEDHIPCATAMGIVVQLFMLSACCSEGEHVLLHGWTKAVCGHVGVSEQGECCCEKMTLKKCFVGLVLLGCPSTSSPLDIQKTKYRPFGWKCFI